jgi:UDP-GlcNAc:undecaprenyl-phosphate GlcNAc-1-phosphate transferase
MVVIIRWRLGKPFYIGDNNHISHRLVKKGLTSQQAVLLIWALSATIDRDNSACAARPEDLPT